MLNLNDKPTIYDTIEGLYYIRSVYIKIKYIVNPVTIYQKLRYKISKDDVRNLDYFLTKKLYKMISKDKNINFTEKQKSFVLNYLKMSIQISENSFYYKYNHDLNLRGLNVSMNLITRKLCLGNTPYTRLILNGVYWFRKYDPAIGYPSSVESYEKWMRILDDIILGFSILQTDEIFSISPLAEHLIKIAKSEFIKYYNTLWQ